MFVILVGMACFPPRYLQRIHNVFRSFTTTDAGNNIVDAARANIANCAIRISSNMRCWRAKFAVVNKGCVAQGSSRKTSAAAPARCPDFSASYNACSSTIPPLETLIRNAPDFICCSRAALNIFSVSGVKGVCRLIKSLCAVRVSSETYSIWCCCANSLSGGRRSRALAY